jgi:ankyrin repeat protein
MHKHDRDYLAAAFSDLINYGADDPLLPVDPVTHRTPEGDSCLHVAAERGDLRAVRLLVCAGLDVNLRGHLGNTPLHYARKGLHHAVVDFLLNRGALPGIANVFGERAGTL